CSAGNWSTVWSRFGWKPSSRAAGMPGAWIRSRALKTKWFSKGRKRSRAAPFILAAAAIVGGPLWRCAMVRCAWGFVAFGLLLLTGVGRADDNECRAIIDKSIKAVGGSERLAKYKAQTWKEKGTFYGEGAAQPYTGNYAVQWPDQFRMEIEGVFTLV